MDPADAVPAERWLDILQPNGYRKIEYGYCIMPDGSGYYAEYYLSPAVIGPGMRPWYMKWMNHKSKGMLPGEGNLRYKLWMHLDHWDHKFVNGADGSDGVWAKGSLDLGKSRIYSEEISHTVNLREYGLSEERERELKEAGCNFSGGYEDVEGGHHLVLRLNRPCPFGGMFITHDMSVVRHLSDDICVMYLGQVVEICHAKQIFQTPMHPYTKVLLSAIPTTDLDNQPNRIVTKGELTSPIDPKPGCRFAARCAYACARCTESQHLEELESGHFVACCRARELV